MKCLLKQSHLKALLRFHFDFSLCGRVERCFFYRNRLISCCFWHTVGPHRVKTKEFGGTRDHSKSLISVKTMGI